jgi:hypothetical protein
MLIPIVSFGDARERPFYVATDHNFRVRGCDVVSIPLYICALRVWVNMCCTYTSLKKSICFYMSKTMERNARGFAAERSRGLVVRMQNGTV